MVFPTLLLKRYCNRVFAENDGYTGMHHASNLQGTWCGTYTELKF